MKKLQKIEFALLAILWFGALLTYPIAFIKGYTLFQSDILGLLGLAIVSIYAFINPNKATRALFILLLLGLFNILSFIYFFNVILSFGSSRYISSGIQLLSLILLGALVIIRREMIFKLFDKILGPSKEEKRKIEEDQRQTKITQKDVFKSRFEHLTKEEIRTRLETKLVPEARDALIELLEERNQA